jgi:uroporphyrinogen-III decarboxylase
MKLYSKKERVLAVLSGEIPDRVPIFKRITAGNYSASAA